MLSRVILWCIIVRVCVDSGSLDRGTTYRNSNKEGSHEWSVVHSVTEYFNEIPGPIRKQLQTLISRQLAIASQSPSLLDTSEYGDGEACPEVTEELDLDEFFRDLDLLVHDASESCPFCENVMTLLQRIACAFNYQPLLRAFVAVCEFLFSRDEHKDQAMCNGTIYLQFPAVYTTLRGVSPHEFCETLNQCYPPPRENTLSVHERMERMLAAHGTAKTAHGTVTTAHGANTAAQTRPESGRKSQIKVAHLTDAHVHTLYATGSHVDCGMYMCCLDGYTGKGSARIYGEYECNIPERTFHHLLQSLASNTPDIILYTGDSAPHTIWTETINSKLNCSSLVIDALKNIVSGVRTYPTLGNHEMFPTGIYSLQYNGSKILNEGYAKLWKYMAGFGTEQEVTMREMAVYSMSDPVYSKLRIISINTNHYWSTRNFMSPLNKNSSAEKNHRQFVEQSLFNARENEEKVILLGHHPVASSGSIIEATRWWEDVVLQYSDVIIMHLAGHTHQDEFHLFIEPGSGVAKAINYVGPAATSNYYVNPAYRMYYLDTDTLEVHNYENYHLHLDAQKPDMPPPVVKSYDAKTLYGIPDLSPKSWQDLSVSFLDDDDKFKSWYANRDSRASDGQCTSGCKYSQLCYMWFVNYDDIEECMRYQWPTDSTNAVTGSTWVVCACLLVMWTFRL